MFMVKKLDSKIYIEKILKRPNSFYLQKGCRFFVLKKKTLKNMSKRR